MKDQSDFQVSDIFPRFTDEQAYQKEEHMMVKKEKRHW